MKDTIKTNKITEGVIWKQLLAFFFPILLGTFFQQLYNTADAIIVGRFVGKEALAAVGGTTGTLINLLVGFFVGLSSGATVIISQFFGGKNQKQVKEAVHTAIALSIVGGAILMVMGIIFAPYAMQAMGNPEEIMPHSLIYIRIYFGGVIFNLLYNMGAGILRAIGDSKRPLYYLVGACLINIVLDILFVVVFHWGVAGVGIATVASQIFSAIMVLRSLIRTKECYRLIIKEIHFSKNMLKRIIRIGLPTGFQSVMYSLSNIIIQASVNSFGTNTIAAWTAMEKIDSLYWMTIGAFGVSITTFVGQNYGAGQYDRVKKSVRDCIKIAAGTTIIISLLICFVGKYMLYLFTKDAAVISEGINMIYFMAPTFITFVAVEILSGALRGMGDTFIPMMITCLGVCVLRVAWIGGAVPFWHDMRNVMFCYPFTWTVTSLLFILYYMKFKKKNLIT